MFKGLDSSDLPDDMKDVLYEKLEESKQKAIKDVYQRLKTDFDKKVLLASDMDKDSILLSILAEHIFNLNLIIDTKISKLINKGEINV